MFLDFVCIRSSSLQSWGTMLRHLTALASRGVRERWSYEMNVCDTCPWHVWIVTLGNHWHNPVCTVLHLKLFFLFVPLSLKAFTVTIRLSICCRANDLRLFRAEGWLNRQQVGIVLHQFFCISFTSYCRSVIAFEPQGSIWSKGIIQVYGWERGAERRPLEQKVQRDGKAQAGLESAMLCVTQRRIEGVRWEFRRDDYFNTVLLHRLNVRLTLSVLK